MRFDPSERPSPLRAAGLLIGFVGVVTLMGIDVVGSGREFLGAAAVLISAVGYAVGPMILKNRLDGLDPRALMAGGLLAGAVILTPLAVLDAPKISDGEVEKFALQKNVLEAVLRQIPLKRRFMKNYIVVRNLVSNPRTPLDLGLGLMKHLLTQDLKNISANKEVSETVRKLALKMYKQKMDAANKK